MKIVLAMLASEKTGRYNGDINDVYPIGIGYLHSVLEQAGHDVRTIVTSNLDYGTSDKRFKELFRSFNPDVVGFSMFSSNRVSTFRMIEWVNSVHIIPPKIIIGGIHASVMYEQIIEKYPDVIAVIGEGERTFLELITAFERHHTKLDSIKGIAFYNGKEIITTETRPLIQDLDSLPFPKHEIFFSPQRTIATMFTARGCPSRCTFCCLKVTSRGRYRKRSVGNVFAEIQYLKTKYPQLKHIQILDDTFLLDNKRVIELCKLIIDANLGITFGCIARVKPISSEMFSWMEKAGFVSIEFGLETGSQKMLDSIQKDINLSDVTTLIKTLKPFKFKIYFLVMAGFPGETYHTIKESIEFIRSIQKEHYVNVLTIGVLQVFPGTEVYAIMKKAGQINDNYWITNSPVPYYDVDYTVRELESIEKYMINRIGIKRIFMGGFAHQIIKAPKTIVPFLLRHREYALTAFEWLLIQKFPTVHKFARSKYARN